MDTKQTFDIFKIKYYKEQTVMNTSILCNVNLITVTLSLKEKPPNFLFYCISKCFIFMKKPEGVLNFTYIFVWSRSTASIYPGSHSHLPTFTVEVRLPSSLLPDPWSPLTLLPPTILLSGLSPPSTNTTKCKATDTKKKADCYSKRKKGRLIFLYKSMGFVGTSNQNYSISMGIKAKFNCIFYFIV